MTYARLELPQDQFKRHYNELRAKVVALCSDKTRDDLDKKTEFGAYVKSLVDQDYLR
jgi:hypothetical protein